MSAAIWIYKQKGSSDYGKTEERIHAHLLTDMTALVMLHLIDDVLPTEDKNSEIQTENMEVIISTDDYLI